MAYDKPKIDLVNKKYETLNKGLEKMYGDVQKNQAAIRKRNLAQQKGEVARLKKYQNRFINATSKDFKDAQQIVGNISDKKMQGQFTSDLNSQFATGLGDIKKFIDEGATDAQIEGFVQEMIGKSETFTNGLIGINAYATERDAAFQKNAKSGGTAVGSLVVNDNYPKILSTLGSGEDVDFGNLRIHGSIKDGVSIFTDKETVGDNGEVIAADGEYQDGEILDLSVVGKDYKAGKDDYFESVKSYDKYKGPIKTFITTHKQDQSFYKKLVIEDDQGNKTEKFYIDAKARNDYFLNGEGAQKVQEVYDANPQALIQKVGGTKLLQEYTALEGLEDEESVAKRAKIEEIAKTALIEDIGGDLKPDNDKALSTKNFSNGRTYTTNDPGRDAIYEVAKANHETTKDVLYGVHTGANGLNTGLAGMKTNFVGKYIKATGANRDIGHGMITDITVGSNPSEYLVTMQVNNPTDTNDNKKVQIAYDFRNENEKEFFERDILHGSFPSARANGNLKAMVDAADNGDERFKGKTTTSTSNNSGSGVNAVDEADGEETIEESKSVQTSQEMLEEYFGVDQANNNPSNNAAVAPANNAAVAATPNNPVVAPANNTVVGPADFNTSNFSINPSGGIEPAQGASPDATSSIILGIMNDEDTIGASGGGGVGNFGFTGGNNDKGKWLLNNAFEPMLKQLKLDYPGLDAKQYEAMAAEGAIEKYIIGKGSPTMGKGNTTIIDDLGVSYDEFDKFPPALRRTLIDYKLNSGRSSKDLIAVALGIETGVDAYLDNKISDVNNYNYNLELQKPGVLSKLTPEKLEEARDDMYLGPINVLAMSLFNEPSGNDDIGKKSMSYADRVYAADKKWTAWTTSQGKRGGSTGDKGAYGVIAKLNKKPSMSAKANNFSDIITGNSLPTDAEFNASYKAAKAGDYLINTKGELKQKQ